MRRELDTECTACGNIFSQGELIMNNANMWACPKCNSALIKKIDKTKKGPFKYNEVSVRYEDGEEN